MSGERGRRGQEASGDTTVVISSVQKESDSCYAKQKKHSLFRKYAGIEPVIGHCKPFHPLDSSFDKRLPVCSVNIMLAAAAFNFKRVMNLLFLTFRSLANMVFGWFGSAIYRIFGLPLKCRGGNRVA